MDGARPAKQAEVVLGEDWIGGDAAAESQARAKRERRGVIAMNRSPLARKIITFNLMAMIVLVAGVLYLNPFRDSLVLQRESGLVAEAQLIANVFEAQLPNEGAVNLASGSVSPDLAPFVVTAWPADGQRVAGPPATLDLTFSEAVRAGDSATIGAMIDWPSFRESVRRTVARNANLLPIAEQAARRIDSLRLFAFCCLVNHRRGPGTTPLNSGSGRAGTAALYRSSL